MTALTDARLAIGGLSRPSKMPGLAYSIPATDCKAGAKLRDIPNSVCSDCYALKGRYMFANVQNALQRRAATISDPAWCANMATAINGQEWFRWHDSGDLQSVEHLAKIVEVCNATPDTRHWLPTREKGIVREYRKTRGNFPPNLVVRLSAAMIDGKPPKASNTSTVHTETAFGHACPAPSQGNKCGDCRACWDPKIRNISYAKH